MKIVPCAIKSQENCEMTFESIIWAQHNFSFEHPFWLLRCIVKYDFFLYKERWASSFALINTNLILDSFLE